MFCLREVGWRQSERPGGRRTTCTAEALLATGFLSNTKGRREMDKMEIRRRLAPDIFVLLGSHRDVKRVEMSSTWSVLDHGVWGAEHPVANPRETTYMRWNQTQTQRIRGRQRLLGLEGLGGSISPISESKVCIRGKWPPVR